MIVRFSFFERLLHRLHLLPLPIMDAFGNVLFGRTLAIAVRRGVFELLEREPMSVEAAADRLKMSEEGVRLLLEVCATGGYLARTGEIYRNTVTTKRWLLKDSPRSLYSLVLYFEMLHTRWLTLESALDHGKPPRPYYALFSDEEWKTYVYGMRDLSRLLLPYVMKQISLPASASRLLDLGGSHGFYSIALCQRYRTVHADIVDFPAALVHASAFVEEAGLGGRIRLQAGELLTFPLEPGQYHTVLLFNVVHGFSAEENRVLLRKALAALAPGGKCYILDQFRTEGRATPLGRFVPQVVGLNLLNEIGGTVYTFAQVRAWCEHCCSVRFLSLPLPGVGLVEVVRR